MNPESGVTRSRPLLLAIGAAAAVAVAAGAGWAANRAAFTDPEGDAGGGPDIRAVTVSNDDAGTLVFQVEIPNRPSVDPNLAVLVALDTDRNQATGEPELQGAERVLILLGDRVAVASWNGSALDYGVPASLRASYRAGPTFTIGRGDVGVTGAFDFAVAAADLVTEQFDVAPDDGTWSYSLTPPLRLTAGPARVTPARPAAGRPFSASVPVTRSDTGGPLAAGTVTCRLTAGGVPVRGVVGSLRAGVATCRTRLPASARGKQLRGTITVTYQGARVARTYAARVAG